MQRSHLNLSLPHNLTVHGSWATRHTLDNGDVFHHFWAEWEAEQGWEGAGPPGLKDPHVLTICCRLFPSLKMTWREVMVCVNRRELYETSMSTLTWYHLFKCKGFGRGNLCFCIRIHFCPADDLPQNIQPFVREFECGDE